MTGFIKKITIYLLFENELSNYFILIHFSKRVYANTFILI